MNIFKTLILFLSLSNTTFAATTLSSVSGASVATKATDSTAWTIFGGMQLALTLADYSCNDTSTCNTCAGDNDGATPPKHFPCNRNGVFAATKLTIAGTTPTVTTGGSKWILCDGSSDEIAASANLTANISKTWGEICGELGGQTDCSTNFSKSLVFGAAPDCNSLNAQAATEKTTVKIAIRGVDLGVISTYDPTTCTDPGACKFGLHPGDEKVYLENEITTIDTSTGISDIPYTGLAFFYAEQSAGETGNDQTTFERVFTPGNIGDIIDIPVDSDADTLDGSFIDGLENNKKYCFKMGSLDAAGNIDHISSTDCQAADCTTTTPAVCMVASEVVGLLTDKKCFIATAAYGSEMDAHVQMLREFRNEFMAPFWLGRKLVKAYYSVSPKLAAWISNNENAKTVSRWALWPVMGWAELALKYGWSVVLAPFVLLALMFLAFKNLFRRYNKA